MKVNDIFGLGMVSGSVGNVVENQNNETRCGITFERRWPRLETSKLKCEHMHTSINNNSRTCLHRSLKTNSKSLFEIDDDQRVII